MGHVYESLLFFHVLRLLMFPFLLLDANVASRERVRATQRFFVATVSFTTTQLAELSCVLFLFLKYVGLSGVAFASAPLIV